MIVVPKGNENMTGSVTICTGLAGPGEMAGHPHVSEEGGNLQKLQSQTRGF